MDFEQCGSVSPDITSVDKPQAIYLSVDKPQTIYLNRTDLRFGRQMAFLRTGAGEKLRIGQLLDTFQPRIPMNQLPRLMACFVQNPV
jgi:hypothetical protein